MMKWMQLHSSAASLVFHECFTINQRRVELIGENQKHWNPSYVDKKSDVLAMTPDGSLYPSSADMSSTALIYLPDTSLMSNGCGKHAGTNSIYCPSHNAVHENMGFAPSIVVDRVLQLHELATTLVQDFSHYMITDSAALMNRCRNLSAVLQLPRVLSSSSLLLMILTKT